MSNNSLSVSQEDIRFDRDTASAHGREDWHITIVVVMAVARRRLDAIQSVERPWIQRRPGSFVSSLRSQDSKKQLVQSILLWRDFISKCVVRYTLVTNLECSPLGIMVSSP